jgi:hypothetical protein
MPACVRVEVTFLVCNKTVRAGGSFRVDLRKEVGIGICRNRNIRDGYGCDGLSGRA